MEVLAKLYIPQNMHELAMDIYLQLQRSDVFDFMLQHVLLRFLTNKIVRLISLDEDRALTLLCDHADEVQVTSISISIISEFHFQPSEVIEEVTAAMRNVADGSPDDKRYQTWRKWLYRYMDRLIMDNISAAPDYHHLLVELYADYEPSALMKFLRMSHQYPLDQAYEICKERGMIKEMVYILSRMGNTHEALQQIGRASCRERV